MNINKSKKIFHRGKIFYLSLLLLFNIKFFFEYTIFDYKIIGDTSVGYNIFQYLYNNFSIENKIIPWIEFVDGGYPNILDLKFWNSFFIYPFLILSYVIKNPYISFNLYLSFIFITLVYSINRNLEFLDLKNKNLILLFIAILTLFTLDFNYMHQHILSSIWLMYVNFRIQKYFINYKFIELIKILVFGSLILYFHPTYLNLIYIFYFGFLFFFIFLLLNLNQTIKKFKIKKKNFYFLILSFFIVFLAYFGLDYEREIINVLSSGRSKDDLKVSYESWFSLNSFDPKVSLGHFFYQDWIANYFPLNISFVGIFLILFFLISKNKSLFLHSNIIAQFILVILLFYLAHFSSFYIFGKYLSKFLYNFVPFMDYTRNFIFVLFGAKCLMIICLAFLLDKFLNNIKNFSLSDLTKISLIFIFLYSEFLFSFFKNAIDKKIYIFFISISIIFISINFVLIFMKKLDKKNFMSLVVLSVFAIYLSNFYGAHYKVIKPKKFEKFDEVYFNDKVNISEDCFSSRDTNKIYDYYLSYNLNRYTQKWNTFLLNSKLRPCEVVTNQVIVSKYSDLTTEKLFIINATKAYSHKTVDGKYGQYWERPNHEYNIKKNYNGINYKISNVYTNEDSLKFNRISNSNYRINKNPIIKNISTKIRYDDYWKILNNSEENYIQIVNNNGYLEIRNLKGISEVKIKYVNILLDFINHITLIISLFIVIFTLTKIFKNEYS